MLEHEPEQLLDPLLRRALEEPMPARAEGALDVQQPPYLTRVSTGIPRRFVDRAIRRAELIGRHVPERREPSVGFLPGQPQHPGLVGADPKRDGVRRGRTALGAANAVVLTIHIHPPARRDVPDLPDHVDRLAECVDGLAGREAPAAHRLDRIPEPARADRQLYPPGREQIKARRRARHHRRWAQGQVQDIGGDSQRLGLGGNPGQQRPRIQEGRLVGVILERREVEAGPLGELRQRDDVFRPLVLRSDECAEGKFVTVVRH